LVAATLVGAMLTVFGPTSTAQADPECKTNGYYVLFVRGSGEGFNDLRANQFYWSLVGSNAYPGKLGPAAGWAELGHLDGDADTGKGWDHVESGEYPAVPVNWSAVTGDYGDSVEVGKNELITHLNRRYGSTPGPWVSNCSNETLVLGGYSQGADVIGWALRSSELSQAAKDHIGYVALYGDPKFNPGPLLNRITNSSFQSNWWWARGNDAGWRIIQPAPLLWLPVPDGGILGARDPYLPTELKGRVGSWCAQFDIVCSGGGWKTAHENSYQSTWIPDSAREIADIAKIKRDRLSVGNTSSSGITNTTAQPASAQPSRYETDPTPNVPPPPVIQSIKRTKDSDGVNQVYAATNSAITEGWWKPNGDGVHTKEVIHISQDNIVGFDKTNLPEGKQALFTAVPDGIWETWWDPQHDPQSAKIITDLTGVRQVIADNRWEGTNHDQYVHRLYVLADQGPYEFWWKDGEKDSNGNNVIHKNLLDSITGGVTMTSSTAPDGSYELYVATPTWAYELKWNPGADFHHRPMINITQGDINSLSKVTVGSEERLFTGTSTGTWQGKWVGDGSPANNPEVNGKVGVISSQGMYTGNAFQIYLLTASGVTEFWYTPTNAGNGPIMSRSQGDLTSFTKFNDGAAQQVYTGTVNGEVLETYWGGGASLTTKPLFTVNR